MNKFHDIQILLDNDKEQNNDTAISIELTKQHNDISSLSFMLNMLTLITFLFFGITIWLCWKICKPKRLDGQAYQPVTISDDNNSFLYRDRDQDFE